MYYTSFTEHITVRYGIIAVNWPLPKFINPSSVSMKTELELLWNAWETNTAHFHRMTTQEYADWHAKYRDSTMPSGLQSESRDNALEGEGHRAAEAEAPGSQNVGLGTSVTGATFSSAAGPSKVGAMNVGADPAMKRTRKVRSDKGQPCKKKSAMSENVSNM